MKRKMNSKQARKNQNGDRSFQSIDAVNAHFFPKSPARPRRRRGKEQGDEAAKHEFVRIVESLND